MKRLPWILFIICLLGNLFLGYVWIRDHYSGGKSLRIQNDELAVLLKSANIRADSLQIKLDETLLEYEALLSQAESLKGERDSVLSELEEKKVHIRQLIYKANQGDPQALLAANNKVKELEAELGLTRSRVEVLEKDKQESDQRFAETKQMLSDVEEARDLILEEHTDLQEKAKKSRFQVSELRIEPLQDKRGSDVLSNKAGKISKLRITFVLEKNELLEPGEKVISVRILGTNGEVLGAGNETLQDSDKLISMQQKISYGGTQEDISFVYTQDEAYRKGIHTVEVLSDGVFLTRGSFKLE